MTKAHKLTPIPKNQSAPRDDKERKLIKKIGDKIRQDLHDKEKPIKWLAFKADTGRATIRRIYDGKSNVGLLTLHRLAKGLGYKDVFDFLSKI